MIIGVERPSYFKGGTLRFGVHAVDSTTDIPLMAQDIAGDIAVTFQRGANNLALVETADVTSSVTRRHRLYYSQYPSHVTAFAAVKLEEYGKKINTKTIGQILDIYVGKNEPTVNFLLSYLQSLDLLTKRGFSVAVVYEDNQIPPQVIVRQVQEYQHRYQIISTRADFKSYFDDYIRDIITVRDVQFAHTINDLARTAEANHASTYLFGFLGLSHRKGVTDRLDRGVRDVVTINEIDHNYTKARFSLRELITLRIAYGEPVSDQEWTDYFNYFLSKQK